MSDLPIEVAERAAAGRMHHHYIDLERSEIANARELIKALGQEILRLRGHEQGAGEGDALYRSPPEAESLRKWVDGQSPNEKGPTTLR